MFWIKTRDKTRQELWDRLFALDCLPVKTNVPRFLFSHRSRMDKPYFELDASRISESRQNRFAGHIHKRLRVSYQEALDMVDGYRIAANGVDVVDSPESEVFSW